MSAVRLDYYGFKRTARARVATIKQLMLKMICHLPAVSCSVTVDIQ